MPTDGRRNRKLLSAATAATAGVSGVSGVFATSSEEPDSLDVRCGSGVCFHTYEEFVALHSYAQDAGTGEVVRRQLQAADIETLTSAKISADAVALSTNTYSSLSAASDFIATALAGVVVGNDTVCLSFELWDHCSNYPELEKQCSERAVSPLESAINASDTANYQPWAGMVASQGKWW
jgi:hypothetical protein